jgi:hypothetical protein
MSRTPATCFAPGRVHPGARDGENTCTEVAAIVVEVLERARLVRALPLVEEADARRGDLERLARVRGEAPQGRFAAVVARDERRRAPLVERLRVAKDRRVPFVADGGEDGANVALDAREVRLTAGAKAGERVLRFGGAVNEAREHRRDHV